MSDRQFTDGSDEPDIRAVIFDLGGVILRTDDVSQREQLAQRFGLTRWQLEEIVFGGQVSQQAEAGQASMDEVWEAIRQRLNLKPEEMPAFERGFFGGDRVDFALIDLIRALHQSYRTALLSNAWRLDMPRFLQEDLRIPADTFDVIISSAAYKQAKPHPEIYRLALKDLGVKAEQAVFVDDNARNIAGAQQVGLRTVHFQNTDQAQRALLEIVHLPEAD